MTNTSPSSNPQGWNPPPLNDPTAPPPPAPLSAPNMTPPGPSQSPYSSPGSAPEPPPAGTAPPQDPALAWQSSPPVPGYSAPDYTGALPPAPAQSSPVAWMFGIGGVVLLLVLALGGILWFTKPSNTPAASEPETSPTTVVDDESSAPPAVDLVTDPGTGLSYGLLPAPWAAPQELQGAVGFTVAVGQQFITEDRWAAVISVGAVDTKAFGYTDAAGLPKLAEDLAKLTDQSNYRNAKGEPLEGLKREGAPSVTETTVADKAAVSMEYRLVWTDNAIQDKGETLLITVIDLGDGRAAGFLTSIPDFASDQLDAVRAALDGLQFA